MKQKLMLLLCSVFTLFIGLEIISAKVVCEYENGIKAVFTNENKIIYGYDGKPYSDEIKIHFNIENSSDCPSKLYLYVDGSPGYSESEGFFAQPPTEKNTAVFDLISVKSTVVGCGNVTEIPKKIPELTSLAVTIIEIAVPVLLVVMGTIDLFKGITAQKEDEIKKGQQIFIKRLIVGAIIFFIVVIVRLLISVVAEENSQNIIECIDCFFNGVDSCK